MHFSTTLTVDGVGKTSERYVVHPRQVSPNDRAPRPSRLSMGYGIDGSRKRPSSNMGGHASAAGLVEARSLEEVQSRRAVEGFNCMELGA